MFGWVAGVLGSIYVAGMGIKLGSRIELVSVCKPGTTTVPRIKLVSICKPGTILISKPTARIKTIFQTNPSTGRRRSPAHGVGDDGSHAIIVVVDSWGRRFRGCVVCVISVASCVVGFTIFGIVCVTGFTSCTVFCVVGFTSLVVCIALLVICVIYLAPLHHFFNHHQIPISVPDQDGSAKHCLFLFVLLGGNGCAPGCVCAVGDVYEGERAGDAGTGDGS